MANPWFRMYTDFLNDPKMISLAFEDQRHFIGILALKSDGTLDQECNEKLLDRMVSQRLWVDYAIISDVKKRLVNSGLIDPAWQPLAWNKRQFKSDKDNTSAERQRRFRESQTHNALRNGTVTRLDTEAETESDSELETDSEADKPRDQDQSNPPSYNPNQTTAGLCCRSMVQNGVQGCNPSHPTLIALIDAGATELEFAAATRSAVERGKPNFAYVVGTVKRQREEAAKLVLHKGRLPTKQEALEQSNRAATAGWVPPEMRGLKNAN